MRAAAIAIAVLAAHVAAASPAPAGIVEDCEQNDDPTIGVGACTAVIQSGQYSGAGLAWVHYNRANAFIALGEHARAVDDYSAALRLDPDYAYAYTNRGVAYRLLGEYRRAIADFDQAIRLNPRDAGAYQSRGVAYESLGDFARAVADWEQAIMIEGAARAGWWQEYLKNRGHYAGAIDGVYGPATRKALEACAADPAC